jgi:hypothetical protein
MEEAKKRILRVKEGLVCAENFAQKHWLHEVQIEMEN